MSESLRSLQSLLSETGRREPSLDAQQMAADDSDPGTAGKPRPGARAPLPAGFGARTPPESPGRETGGGEPEAPEGSGSRWRDLNLSFDAEPVVPRARRSGDSASDREPADPEAEAETGEDSTADADHPAPDAETAEPAAAAETAPDAGEVSAAPESDEPIASTASMPEPPEGPEDAGQADPEPDIISYDLRTSPVPGLARDDPGTADDDESPDLERDSATGYDIHSSPDDEVLVLDLDDPGPPSPAPEPAAPAAPDAGHGTIEADTDHATIEADADLEDRGADVAAPITPPDDSDEQELAAVEAHPPESPLSEPAASEPLAVESDLPEGAPDASPARDATSMVPDQDLETSVDAARGALEDDHANEAADDIGASSAMRQDAAPPGPPASQPDIPGRTPGGPAPGDADAAAADDEKAEDQLPLELESAEGFGADIPVLTNAVYVPEAPAGDEPALPGPAESPHEARIGRCIDDLRVRLQLMGLETLSDEQERELHDALVELLDELDHD